MQILCLLCSLVCNIAQDICGQFNFYVKMSSLRKKLLIKMAKKNWQKQKEGKEFSQKNPIRYSPKIKDYTVTFEKLEEMGYVRVIGLGYVHLSRCPT